MSVSTINYPKPVQVNGFTCRNCTDVDYAKKNIDPDHPKSGPYNVNAATDPIRETAVAFGGALSGQNSPSQSGAAAQSAQASGSLIDVRA